MNDSTANSKQYHNFKFVTEQHGSWGHVQPREVTYISAGWNFMILFVVMLMVVLGRHMGVSGVFSVIRSPFQRGGVDKNMRDAMPSSLLKYLLTIVSAILLMSLFVQKLLLIYGANKILYDTPDFYLDIVYVMTAVFVFDYLFMAYYSWLYGNDSLLLFHVNLHVGSIELVNMLLIPFLMILFFYPYRFLGMLCLVLVALLYVSRFINFFVEIRLFAKVNFVNIFLYLCTLEIVALLVMSKVIYDAFIAV